MRMARVNVYLPDDLAARARAAGLNVSGLTQAAVRGALAAAQTDEWLDEVSTLSGADVTHEEVLRAVHEARDDLGA